MVKETVKYIDDTEKEFDVYKLSYRKVQMLINKHLPIDRIKFVEGKPQMPEDFNNKALFDLMEECIETIKGIDLDQLEASEMGRLYNTHFERSIALGLGGTGNPNLRKS